MPTPALPDDVLIEAVRLRNQHPTLAAAAKAAGLLSQTATNSACGPCAAMASK